MGKIDRCPSLLKKGYNTYSPEAVEQLFGGQIVSHILPYKDSYSRDAVEDLRKGNGRISLSGVQGKMSVVIDNGVLRFTQESEQGRYILKPIPPAGLLYDREYLPANEHLCMQIASQIFGISTANNGLCFFGNGNPAYLAKRFDIDHNGKKIAMEDLAGLAGLTKKNGGSDYKYCNLSYEECGNIIRKHTDSENEILKFFRLVIYNYLISNDDAHLKNFSLITNQNGKCVLSPAYDLVNTFLHLGQPRIFALDKGLFKEGKPGNTITQVSKEDFEEFGRRLQINAKTIQQELSTFANTTENVKDLIERSFLSKDLKNTFWKTFCYRQGRIR